MFRSKLQTLTHTLILMGALLCVFSLYLQPEFIVHLTNQLWVCF